MKTIFAALALALTATPALADGFICESEADSLVLKVFHHTAPSAGTRNSAVMILSDASVQAGNKTIARFRDTNLTLGNEASVYTAKVDHRFNDSNREGELIGGTKIGNLKYVVLDVDFSYGRPVAAGTLLRGDLTLVKRDGTQIDLPMVCARYLKN
jgi:hypothetical protein